MTLLKRDLADTLRELYGDVDPLAECPQILTAALYVAENDPHLRAYLRRENVRLDVHREEREGITRTLELGAQGYFITTGRAGSLEKSEPAGVIKILSLFPRLTAAEFAQYLNDAVERSLAEVIPN